MRRADPDRPEPNRTEPIQFVLHAAGPLRGGAVRGSGVVGEEKGLATHVAAPSLPGQPFHKLFSF